MELEQSSVEFKPVQDRRPTIPEPLPVRLIAVADVRLHSAAGFETQLDDFYSRLLLMVREPDLEGRIAYRADNFRLILEVVEPPVLRDDLRPIGIEVPSLLTVEHKLIDAKIQTEWCAKVGTVPTNKNAKPAEFMLGDPAFPFTDGERPPARIVFAGNLGYFPNVDAAAWLARDILPRLRAARADVELRLVGARPARAIRALASEPGVSLAASVPAMAPELAAATVALIPLRAGSGLQNKVLEAMSVGTPVVATPRG